MRRDVAIWIDHREAVITTIEGETETTTRMLSHVEHGGPSDTDSRAEDQRDRRFANHLRVYYDSVVSRVKGANGILLLGPGEAKHELEKRIRDEGLGDRIVGVETADKLTDHQVAAKARKQFLT
jgi:stalled ribosome rescue protein Dom34